MPQGSPETIRRLALAYRQGELTPLDDAVRRIERIRRLSHLNALHWFDEGRFQEEARRAALAFRSAAARGWLAGIPLAIKDNIATAGVPTTNGSAARLRSVPEEDAAVWRRLAGDADAILLGKANLSEFAYRAPHPDFGEVLNPHDPSRSPGASSSGSAVAVAAGLAAGALGTDTGGSVRVPAAFCGVVGFKPTYGVVPCAGVTPLSPCLDHVGFLTRDVSDAAILFQCATGSAAVDLAEPVPPLESPRGLRIGIVEEAFEGAEQDVVHCWERARERLSAAGCTIRSAPLPPLAETHAAHRTILLAQAFAYHAEGLDRQAPYGPEFRAAIEKGRSISEEAYREAVRRRAAVARDLQAIFGEVDLLFLPTCRHTAPPIAERHRPTTQNTFLANFVGLPAISVPGGRDRLGLPIGLQLIGPPQADLPVLSAAALLEGLIDEREKP